MPVRKTINSFFGGINNNSPADQIADSELVDALNVIFDKRNNLEVRKGTSIINSNHNLLERTEEFDNAYWNIGGTLTVTPNTDVAPDGTTSADTVDDNDLSALEWITKTITTKDIPDNEVATFSLHIKKSTGIIVEFPVMTFSLVSGGGTRTFGVVFDSFNGTYSVISGGSYNVPVSVTVIDVDDNWWRVGITGLNDTGLAANWTLAFYPKGSSTFTITDGTLDAFPRGFAVIWGAQFEAGKMSDYHKVVGSGIDITSNYLTKKITSVLDFMRSNGDQAIIVTSGTDIWRLNTTDDVFEKITGTLTLPDDTYWQWIIYDDVAIGVNGADTASGKDSIVKIEGITSNAEVLNWNINYLRYTEQFDNLVWEHINNVIIRANEEKSPLSPFERVVDELENKVNRFTRTEELDHSDWVDIGTPIRTVAGNATKLQDDDATNPEGVKQTKTVANDETYVYSVFIAKVSATPGSFPVMRMLFTGGTPITVGAIIDHENGEIFPISGSVPDTIGIEDYDSFFWRCYIKHSNDASGNTSLACEIYPAYSSDKSTLDGTDTGSAFFTRAQLEADELTDYHYNIDQAQNAIYQDVLGVADSETYIGSVYIKKVDNPETYPYIGIDYLGGSTETNVGIIVDHENGVVYDHTGNAPDAKGIEEVGEYYRVWLKEQNNATGNNKVRLTIFPARAGGLTGAISAKAEGIIHVFGAQLEKSTDTAPSKYHSNTSTANVLAPPKGNYIEVWNDRIWVVDADSPNTIVASSLGNFEDYASPGRAGSQKFEIGGQEGDIVTGIKAHRDRLFIFKPDKIYYIQPGTPNTDIEQYQIILLSDNIGCVSGYSIQVVLNDLVFLSKHGLASLSAVEQFGSFAESVISNKIKDLNEFTQDEINSASVINPEDSQYILAAPFSGGSTHTKAWVMDYTNIQQGVVGFTRFDNRMIGASYARVQYQGRPRVYIGGYPTDGKAFLYRYGDDNIYSDHFNELYNVAIKTKAFNVDDFVNNKIFIRVFFTVELLTENLSLGLSYIFDESGAKVKSWTQTFTGEIYTGAFWDVSLWDTGLWAALLNVERNVKRKVVGSPGRIAKSIQFNIANVNINESFVLKSVSFDLEQITYKGS